MPFLGKDWRSSGDEWLKTERGWEKVKIWRLKIFENLNESAILRFMKVNNAEECKKNTQTTKPHILMVKNTTKEQKCLTSLSDAFNRLDICGASRDIKRFAYVCKLVEVIIRNKFPQLSGSAQRNVFQILQELVNTVVKSKNNISTVRKLLQEAQTALNNSKYQHVGCKSLWNTHLSNLQNMIVQLDQLHIDTPEENDPSIDNLPDDCMRQILSKLSSSEDIRNIALLSNRTTNLIEEKRLWRDLCLYYFDDVQMSKVLKPQEDLESIDWSCLYERLVKRYGFKENFVETLQICKNCNALFWSCHGHPCLFPDFKPEYALLSPVMCMELFCS